MLRNRCSLWFRRGSTKYDRHIGRSWKFMEAFFGLLWKEPCILPNEGKWHSVSPSKEV